MLVSQKLHHPYMENFLGSALKMGSADNTMRIDQLLFSACLVLVLL